MIAWWTPAQRRQMFYQNSEGKASNLNGRLFLQPPLVLAGSCDGQLKIRALTQNKRPEAKKTKARLSRPTGISRTAATVCTGSMRRPEKRIRRGHFRLGTGASTRVPLPMPTSVAFTRYKGGFEGRWSGLTGKRRLFPFWRPWSSFPRPLAQFVSRRKELRCASNTCCHQAFPRPSPHPCIGWSVAGGTGSAILMGLPYLDQAMRGVGGISMDSKFASWMPTRLSED